MTVSSIPEPSPGSVELLASEVSQSAYPTLISEIVLPVTTIRRETEMLRDYFNLIRQKASIIIRNRVIPHTQIKPEAPGIVPSRSLISVAVVPRSQSERSRVSGSVEDTLEWSSVEWP